MSDNVAIGSGALNKLRKQAQAEKKVVQWKDTGLRAYAPKKTGGGDFVTTDRLDKIFEVLSLYYELWLGYPDKLIDLYLPVDTQFKLFPFQILGLRANMRHQLVFEAATRGFSKSFKAVLTKYLQCILLPGTKVTMLAEHKTQMARIGREKINELWQLMPGLKNEINFKRGSGTTFDDDFIRLKFKGGSELDLVGITNATRGARRHGILFEEVNFCLNIFFPIG